MLRPLRPILGLDIGGANLKAAHADGSARTIPYALWKRPEGLTEALRGLFRQMPPAEQIAVTMTGELCDCYAHRKEGVHAILDCLGAAVEAEAPRSGGSLLIWQNTGRFCSAPEAKETWLRTASANWLATATFVGRFVPLGAGLFVDVGSTTTDLVPLREGMAHPMGLTDFERLSAGSLLYAGVARTPLHAAAAPASLTDVGLMVSPIPELFAATQDAYVVLGDILENADDRGTADGRPRTALWSANRLLRTLGLDLETAPAEGDRLATALARAVKRTQAGRLQEQMAAMLGLRAEAGDRPQPKAFVLAGSGEFLAKEALQALRRQHESLRAAEVISLSERLGPDLSAAAAAYAVAVLAAEKSA